MTLTAEPIVNEFSAAACAILSGKPYAVIPLAHNSDRLMHSVIRGLFAFDRTVPLEEQMKWEINVPRNPAFDEADDGVIRRNNEKPSDQKLMLHARPDLLKLLRQNGVTPTGAQVAWVAASVALRNSLLAACREFARAIDFECPEYRLVKRITAAEAGTLTSLLRANKYARNGRGYAKEHTDRNLLTIHVGESSPGLYFPHGPELPALSRNYGIVFPGNFFEAITGNAVTASIHGARPVTACSERWSMPFFGYAEV